MNATDMNTANTDTKPPGLERRAFIKLVALSGGGLCLGLFSPATEALAQAAGKPGAASAADVPAGTFAPNVFVQITPEGVVKIFSKRTEMGQGVKTALPMMLAEELEVDFAKVVVEPAPFNPAMGEQSTSGSQSISSNSGLMRRAGATAREMLIAAAAATWGVPATECRAELGKVIHTNTKRSLTYGQLAAKAATFPVPDAKSVTLKNPKDFKIIGKWTPGVDNRKIVTGQPLFGIDVDLPGLLYAVYVRCPVLGGKPVSANLDAIKQLPGVKDAFILTSGNNPSGLRPGVAIVAEHTWAAFAARRHLEVKWDEGPAVTQSTAGYDQAAAALAGKPGARVISNTGDVDAALKSAAKVIEAAYSYPFVSHVPMEPPNCTVAIQDGKMTVWTGTQDPRNAAGTAAGAARLKAEDVTLNIMRCGGAFGRRIYNNFVAEAAAIAAHAGAPVKLTWDRTDDIHGDLFRAGGYDFLRAGLDAAGKVIACHAHFISFNGGDELPGGVFSAAVPNRKTEHTLLSTCLPMGAWRSLGIGAWTFVLQSFVDEVAYAAGKDPLQFRIEQFGNNARSLREVAEKSGWGKKLPKGKGMGVSFTGASAQVAEVTVDKDGTLTVDKITVVASTAPLINPSGALAQIEGSVLDGLSATWLQEITLDKGCITQTNFNDYPILRINQAPKLDIHINIDGFGGMGEPYIPATSAAITNAIFAATGKRVRKLPIRQADLAWT